jgi:hypothetical protein
VTRVPHSGGDEGPGACPRGEIGGGRVSGVRFPDVELAVAETVPVEEVAARVLLADIEVERRAGRIVAEEEGNMGGVAGVERRDVFPRATAHRRHGP